MKNLNKLERLIDEINYNFEINKSQLYSGLKIIKNIYQGEINDGKGQITVLDAEQEFNKFAQLCIKNPDLKYNDFSLRQYRAIALCNKIFKDIDIFITYIYLLKKQKNFSQSILVNLIISYLINYEQITYDKLHKIKQNLLNILESIYTKSQLSNSLLMPFAEKKLYFVSRPEEDIVNYVIKVSSGGGENLYVKLQQLFIIAPESVIYKYALENLFKYLVDNYSFNKNLIFKIFQDKHLDFNSLSKMVSILINYTAQKIRIKSDRNEIIKFIINFANSNNEKYFGDPRLYDRKWQYVDPNARKIFILWLNEENISFFFNCIFDNYDTDQQRKEFWLKYINYIRNVEFYLSEDHLISARRNIVAAETEFGLHYNKAMKSGGSSIFIMHFDDFLIIEASNTNTLAVRVYFNVGQYKIDNYISGRRNGKNELIVYDLKRDNAGEIVQYASKEYYVKNQYRPVKMVHNKLDWQHKMAHFLKIWGIII